MLCEAIYHSFPGLKPCVVKHEGITHWFLRTNTGRVIDPTAEQFNTKVPYNQGKGCGFLTVFPSKRAKILLRRGFKSGKAQV